MSNTTTRVYLSTLDCGDTFDLDAINAYTPYVPAGHYCVKTVDYTDGTVEIQDTSTRTVYEVNNGMVVRVQAVAQ